MRKSRGLCAVLLVFVLAVLAFAAPAGAKAEAFDGTLRFRSDGTFKIVILADTQGASNPSKNMLQLVNDVLDEEQPDFIVYLGDQIKGYDPSYKVGKAETKVKQGIDAVISPAVERGIPFAVVFGNHDQEALAKEKQMEIYNSYPGCMAVDEGDALPGCGTYNVPVYSSDGSKMALNFYFVDSMSGALIGGYENVSEEQIDWCRQKSAELKEQNGGAAVPSIVFQHIAVPEVYEMFSQVDKGTEGAVKGYRVHEGYYVTNPDYVRSGRLMEGPCPPDNNNGQFAGWQEQGDVFAAFFGHDHVNSYQGNYEGIDLVAAPGCTFDSYGQREERGIRTVVLHEDDVTQYDTHVTTFMDRYGHAFATYAKYYLDTPGELPTWGWVTAVVLVAGIAVGVVFLARHVKRKKRTKEKQG